MQRPHGFSCHLYTNRPPSWHLHLCTCVSTWVLYVSASLVAYPRSASNSACPQYSRRLSTTFHFSNTHTPFLFLCHRVGNVLQDFTQELVPPGNLLHCCSSLCFLLLPSFHSEFWWCQYFFLSFVRRWASLGGSYLFSGLYSQHLAQCQEILIEWVKRQNCQNWNLNSSLPQSQAHSHEGKGEDYTQKQQHMDGNVGTRWHQSRRNLCLKSGGVCFWEDNDEGCTDRQGAKCNWSLAFILNMVGAIGASTVGKWNEYIYI